MGNIGPQSIAYSLYRNLPYTPASLIPVSNTITAPNVLVVHPSVPAKTVPEFVAWLKAQNGKASYASSGTGQSPHLSGRGSCSSPAPRPSTCPYRGAAPALNDLIAGVTQFFFDNLTTSVEFMRAGKLRALGLTSAQPNPLTPRRSADRRHHAGAESRSTSRPGSASSCRPRRHALLSTPTTPR
jgi:tripartite-type tricarboxylate transporter receptor subunit TctC